MYHTHVRDELVCRTLREKCLANNAKEQVGNRGEVWEMLDIGFYRLGLRGLRSQLAQEINQ
jgi:hypothetical protein